MRRILLPLLPLLLFGALVATSVPTASGQEAPDGASTEGTCGPGTVEVRGVVRDAATGLRLTETANVDIYNADGSPRDGGGTEPNSSYVYCAPVADGDIKIRFDADHYKPEWWDNQPSNAAATVIDVDVPGPTIANASLVPDGRVIAGRVTNMNGVPKFASIGISRRNAAGNWVSIDGIGNDPATGWYSFRVPSYGRYRVNACVDSHWCQWATSADRLRFARTVVVAPGDASTFVNNVHVRVPYCHAAPTFCVPPGFNS
jgi:hypothetical protein